jgi:hypothetical protein
LSRSSIAGSQPDYRGSSLRASHGIGEVFVLADDDRASSLGLSLNEWVSRLAKPNTQDVNSFMALRR